MSSMEPWGPPTSEAQGKKLREVGETEESCATEIRRKRELQEEVSNEAE